MPGGELPSRVHLVTRAMEERRLQEHSHERIAELSRDCPPAQPEPHDRPTPKAQWDEAHGRWIEWDEATDDWRVLETGAPADATKTPTVDGADQEWKLDHAALLDDTE